VASTVDLVVRLVGDASSLTGVLGKAGGDVGGFGKSLGGLAGTAASILPVAAAVGGVALAIGSMTEAAAADRDEQNKLTAAIAAATGSTTDYTAAVDEAIAAGQARAFTDSDTRAALQSLVTATGDVTVATGMLAQTQDIARLANVDLATAADAVAKAQEGQAGPLAKLIPGIDKAGTSTDVLAAATKLAAGQADTFAKSSEGMKAKGADAFGELGETIGEVFLPVLDALLPIVIQLLQLFGQLVKAVLPLLVPILKLIGAELTVVGNVLSVVVGWLVKLVTWVTNAIGKLGDFLASINPLKGISLPSLPFLSSAVAPSVGLAAGAFGATPYAGGAVSSRAAITVNVYTTGDSIEAERAVVRALTRSARLNAGLAVPALTRAT
jgi:hypothetical protein